MFPDGNTVLHIPKVSYEFLNNWVLSPLSSKDFVHPENLYCHPHRYFYTLLPNPHHKHAQHTDTQAWTLQLSNICPLRGH